MREKERLTPLSTFGIGSVPFRRDENPTRTLFQEWDLPFWPQYPQRSLRENFVFQFLSSFPGLRVSGKAAFFNEADYLRSEKRFVEKLNRAFQRRNFLSFEPPRSWALGYSQMKALLEKDDFPEKRIIKLQVTGPHTVWESFFKKQVSPRSSPRIQRSLNRTLLAAGLAQIQRVLAYGKTPLIFIDEPLRDGDLFALREMIDSFKLFGALVGLHVCSNLNWRGLERLRFDIFHFGLPPASKVTSKNLIFIINILKKKKWVAWGVVPTVPGANPKPQDFSSSLFSLVRELSNRKWPVARFLRQSLFAPACGTGTLSPQEEERVKQSLEMTLETLWTYTFV